MNKQQLEQAISDFSKYGKNAEDLNQVRSEIFNALDNNEIITRTKDNLLKDLYTEATKKGIFFLRVTERTTKDLPKQQPEESDVEYEEEESYSYSYEEDEEE